MARNLTEFELDYQANLRRYDALAREVEFAVREIADRRSVKLHDVEWRVKSLPSCLSKLSKKSEKDNTEDLNDIVGIRIICLFRSDMDKVRDIIRETFIVEGVDDKFQGDPSVFGYMSVHYICRLSKKNSGPRYDRIKDIKFEIQVRTLCVHAWSAVSHYLEYKSEWDVPTPLMKSMNALSAMFYVADTQFEELYKEKLASKSLAIDEAKSSDILAHEINFDTVYAYLESEFPQRQIIKDDVSELVSELNEAEYRTIKDLDIEINRAKKAFKRYEEDKYRKNFFSATGAARVSLVIGSEKYRAVGVRQKFVLSPDAYAEYEKLLS